MTRSMLRAGVAAAAVLSVVAASAATAAPAKKPKPACNLLTDERNDTFLLRTQEVAGQFGPKEDALDLVGADVGTNGKTLTGVIRVAKLARTIATGAGHSYELQFRIASSENIMYVSSTVRSGVETFAVGYRSGAGNTATSLGTATGVFDLKRNEVRISAPLSAFAGQGGIRPGLLISDLSLTASRNLVAVNVFADVAEGSKTYKAGTPTCVPVGK